MKKLIKLSEVSIILIATIVIVTIVSFFDFNSNHLEISNANIEILVLNNKIDAINKINSSYNESAKMENVECSKFIKNDEKLFSCSSSQYKKIYKKMNEIKSL